MNYRKNFYSKYNFDISKNKIKYNKFNKKNYFPYILHNNIKNYRYLNKSYTNNNNITDCSKNCFTKNNKNNKNLYYEKIYGGLDFNLSKNHLECYKIPKFKNMTTLGMQTPNIFITDCSSQINKKICEKREKTINIEINPYIPEFYENIKSNKKKEICNYLNNKNNRRYSSYSNYLKKKKFTKI